MFKQMRAGQMPSAVASSIVEIASHMIKREYVKAHDAYITCASRSRRPASRRRPLRGYMRTIVMLRFLRCAIGNAPWPMGITGTGVHERQGRQHIRSDKIVSRTRLERRGRSGARPTRILLLLTSRSASVDRPTS